MADDLASFADSIGRLPGALQKAQRRGVSKAALFVTRAIRAEIRSSSGGDNRLSGVGRKGAKVGARYDVKGAVNPTAIVRATGPLHFLEHPTSPHRIVPRRKTGKGKRRVLRFSSGNFRPYANHPGTSPSRPFARGVDKTADKTSRIFGEEVAKAVRSVF